MVGTADAAAGDRLMCERCHGYYAVEAPADGSAPRVRCNACGHIRSLANIPVRDDEEAGKWTVIGPDGKTMTFGSWEKLVESGSKRPAPPAVTISGGGAATKTSTNPPDEKKPSATALLDVTPTPLLPKLKLDGIESQPILPASEATSGELPKVAKKSVGPSWAAVKTEKKETLLGRRSAEVELDEALLDDDVEPAPLSLRDAIADDETAPLSLRDVLREDDETSPLSLRDAIPEGANSDPHEVVSMQDVVLLAGDDAVDSSPHPPARGALHTLPPTPSRKGDAAPPPTITVEDEKERTAKAEESARLDTQPTTKMAPKSGAGRAAVAQPKRAGRAAAVSAPTSNVSVKKAKPVADEEPARGWVLPSVAVIAVAIGIWYVMIAPSAGPEPTAQNVAPNVPATAEPDLAPAPASAVVAESTATPAAPVTPAAEPVSVAEPVATVTPAATTAAVAATAAAAAAVEPTDTVATTAATTTEKKPRPSVAVAPPPDPEAAAAAKKAPPAVESMSDLLDRAGSARRSGDFGSARELYERVVRQSPGNVEANGGLGDVARAQGDLAAAKTSYERALAASPTYTPAQLGLADTEWDLGSRSSAQRRYAQIVERLGARAPERAKQRGATE